MYSVSDWRLCWHRSNCPHQGNQSVIIKPGVLSATTTWRRVSLVPGPRALLRGSGRSEGVREEELLLCHDGQQRLPLPGGGQGWPPLAHSHQPNTEQLLEVRYRETFLFFLLWRLLFAIWVFGIWLDYNKENLWHLLFPGNIFLPRKKVQENKKL